MSNANARGEVKGRLVVTYRALPACGYSTVGSFAIKEEAQAIEKHVVFVVGEA